MKRAASLTILIACLLGALALGAGFSGPARAAENGQQIKHLEWSFEPPFGTFKPGQLQRGYKVYKEVCSACHGLRHLYYRNLGEPGGPEFSEAEVKALAAQAEVTDGPNDQGEMFTRPGKPSDPFVEPYKNDQEARAVNNGALPPDLSLIAKARSAGPDYIYSLLTGYEEKPADMEMPPGMSYNTAFEGHQIAMPPPLNDGLVEYTDGTEPTVENYAKDVAAFLMWAAEPKLEERHKVGFRMMIYLALLAGFLYMAKRRVWSNLEH